jgi:Tol biopolymer transport system component
MLAFNRFQGGEFGMAVMDAYGRDLRSLGPGTDPAWSPNGTRIAFGTLDGIGIMNADKVNDSALRVGQIGINAGMLFAERAGSDHADFQRFRHLKQV